MKLTKLYIHSNNISKRFAPFYELIILSHTFVSINDSNINMSLAEKKRVDIFRGHKGKE